MLNELRELSISLEKAGINPPDFHPKFPLCPKKAAFWVYIDNDGNVTGVSSIPIEQVQKIRKWEGIGANGTSFPAFSVPPLLKVTNQEHRKKLATMKRGSSISPDEVRTIAGMSTNLWSDNLGKKSNALDKVNLCMDKPVKDLLSRFTDVPAEFSAINSLLSRACKIDSSRLFSQMQSELIKLLNNGDVKAIDALFFYGESKPTSQNDFQTIFEIKERTHFPANHQEVQKWMNSKLLLSSAVKVMEELDAFGCNASGKDEKYPDIRFKNALGNIKLRAMNQESPCQARYGMIDHYSFPTGGNVRKELKRALEWIGADDQKGKTWCDLSRRMERAMLLFAYPSEIPIDLPDLAGMLGDTEDEDTETQKDKFSAIAEKVILALRGRTNETVDAEIRVFVLAKRKGDARTKVVASNRYSAEHVVHSAQLWQEGSRNVPKIAVRSFGKNKGDKPVWSELMIPFPAEAIWCLNTLWTRQGTHAEGVQGFSVNDALCLLLGVGFELQQVAGRALGSVLRNSSSLFLAVGQANAQGLVHKTERKYAKQMILLPSLLGLLLYKLNYKKGGIMTTPAFLIGKLLNLSDSLHLEYCKGPRKGSIPPQLVGNALMATALESPEKALSMLSQRVLPYQAWARTLTGGDEVRLAKFFLKQLGEVTDQLKDVSMLQRSSDADKAQMLLGYLARIESEKN